MPQDTYTHIPYTYLVGWSHLDKFYYGVRYARNCNPSDLLESYFTSSKVVDHYIQKHGLPDVKLVRRTFTDQHKAVEWEHKVLRRLQAAYHDKLLNQRHGKAIVLDGVIKQTKSVDDYVQEACNLIEQNNTLSWNEIRLKIGLHDYRRFEVRRLVEAVYSLPHKQGTKSDQQYFEEACELVEQSGNTLTWYQIARRIELPRTRNEVRGMVEQVHTLPASGFGRTRRARRAS